MNSLILNRAKIALKPLVLGFILLSIAFSFSNAAFADEDQNSKYTIKQGDNLWNIADSELGNARCWPLIASIPENDIDYQGYIYTGDNYILPSVSDCENITNPANINGEYSDRTIGFYPHKPWFSKGNLVETFVNRQIITNQERKSQRRFSDGYHNYDNMFKIEDENFYRERVGDEWFVVVNGTKRSRSWDYVDRLNKNPETGTYVYRARDIYGDWYVVKNHITTKLNFEPMYLELNFDTDKYVAYGYSEDRSETYFATEYKNWIIPAEVRIAAADNDGNLLLREWKSVKVRTVGSGGEIFETSSSHNHSVDYTYWVNDQKIADTIFRMVPQFSETSDPVKLPFFFSEQQSTVKYYGDTDSAAFDANGNVVIYLMDDTRLYKRTIQINN